MVEISASSDSTSKDVPFEEHLRNMVDPTKREKALDELIKKRDEIDNLPSILWQYPGVTTVLLHELTSVYSRLSPPRLTSSMINRSCNVLALFQCMASNSELGVLLVSAHIPLFIYPFLIINMRSRPYEYLRLTSLGFIGALIKNDDTRITFFLIQTEIVPLCLHVMQNGSELSKTVATFILLKVIEDENGLAHVCASPERFISMSAVLRTTVMSCFRSTSTRLLNHLLRVYVRLTDNPRGKDSLRSNLPYCLRDSTFEKVMENDKTTKQWLTKLLHQLGYDQYYSNQAGYMPYEVCSQYYGEDRNGFTPY